MEANLKQKSEKQEKNPPKTPNIEVLDKGIAKYEIVIQTRAPKVLDSDIMERERLICAFVSSAHHVRLKTIHEILFRRLT